MKNTIRKICVVSILFLLGGCKFLNFFDTPELLQKIEAIPYSKVKYGKGANLIVDLTGMVKEYISIGDEKESVLRTLKKQGLKGRSLKEHAEKYKEYRSKSETERMLNAYIFSKTWKKFRHSTTAYVRVYFDKDNRLIDVDASYYLGD